MHPAKLSTYDFLFENAPVAAAILEAGTLKLKMANRQMLDFWARPASVVDTPLLEFLPELKAQPYPQHLNKVVRTGKPISEKGASVFLNRYEKEELIFMDYSYTPIGDLGRPNGILVIATDVCERELNRLAARQQDYNMRALVMSAPIPMCVFQGPEFKVETINHHMLDLWQDTRKMNLKALAYVFHSGIAYTMIESGVQYTYTPLFDAAGAVTKVSLMANSVADLYKLG